MENIFLQSTDSKEKLLLAYRGTWEEDYASGVDNGAAENFSPSAILYSGDILRMAFAVYFGCKRFLVDPWLGQETGFCETQVPRQNNTSHTMNI